MPHTFLKQRTLRRPAQVAGFGYWTGQDANVEFHPAPAGSGIVFVRTDLPGRPRVKATVANRVETPRRTTLVAGKATVEMVEHVMAALAGLRIDNCEIHVDAREIPGCDGSSLTFVEALLQAGTVEIPAPRRMLVITEPLRVGNAEAWVEARPSPAPGLSIRYRLDYGDGSPIPRQTLDLSLSPESFCEQLAPARTFLLRQEADWLRERGLGERASYRDVIVFDENGPIDNELRFEDECVRHKALDLIGDLGLAQCDLSGRVIAHRSGHRLNAELVSALLQEGRVIEPLRKSA